MTCWVVGAISGVLVIACTFGVNILNQRITERDAATKITHKTEHSYARPHLTISDLGLFDADGNPVRHIRADSTYHAVFTVRNSGQTIAKDLICRSNWFRSDKPFPQEPPYATPDWPHKASKVQLPPADTVRHPSLLQPQPAPVFKFIEEGRVTLWMYGELLYSDSDKRNYRTLFCLRYSPKDGEWVFEATYNEAT